MNSIPYKEIISNAPFGCCYLKALFNVNNEVCDFVFIDINETFEKLLGVDKTNALSKAISEVLPGFWKSSSSSLIDIATNLKAYTLEYYSKTTKRYYTVQMKSQEKFYISVLFTDISKEKEIQTSLISSKLNYQLLLDSTHEGILVIQNDKIIFANPKVEAITGYSLTELAHIDFSSLINSEEHSFNSYPELKGEFIKPYQTSIYTKNSHIKWLEVSAKSLEWDNEKSTLIFLSDITKRKEAEDALLQSESKNKTIINSMNDIIFILDYNLVFRELIVSDIKKVSFSPETLIGKEFTKLNIADPSFSTIYTGLLNAMKTEIPQTIEFYLPHNGNSIWFNASITIITKPNANKEILLVLRNITELKTKEQEVYVERELFSEGPVVNIVWGNDPQWSVLRISKNVFDILGYSQDFFTKNSFNYLSLVHFEDIGRVRAESSYNIENNINTYEQSYRLLDSKGNYRWFYVFTKIIRNIEDKISEIRGYIFDQTHIKEMEFQLEKEKRRLENIIIGTRIGTWEWNVQTGETTFNEYWAQMLGYNLEDISPSTVDTWAKFCHPEDFKKSSDLLNKHFYGDIPYYECEIRMKHKNGNWIWVLDKGKVLSFSIDKKPLLMFGTHMDITERKLFEEKIINLSIKDPLTNIYNRRYMFDRLHELKAKYQRHQENFSIVIIDIDHFKVINDNYGHLAGDYILQELTKLIGKNIRPFDLLGRYGGEEFIILLSNCLKSTAYDRIHSILKLVRNTTFIYNNNKISFTFSAGISDSNDLDLTKVIPDKFIDIADKRLYHAKDKGRNSIVIND